MATRASSEEYDFDLFTIGGGTAGVRASRLSATMGEICWADKNLSNKDLKF